MNLINWISSRTGPRAHVSILLILAVIVMLLPAGGWDLRGPDEGRYTQVARELLTSDNWLALKVMGHPYDQKPPLAFWMLAGMLKLTGGEPNSGVLRMPSIFAAIGMLLLTYLLGRKFAGERAGIVSGVMLISSFCFLDDGPAVELNMLFSFFITASMAVWLFNLEKGRLTVPQALAMWLLAAAAFLVKGPLSLLAVGAALGAAAVAWRSLKPFKATRIAWGLPLVLVIIGVWFWGQSRAFGAEFVEKQVSGETVDRFLKGDHGQPFWYYFPRLFTAYMGPWALALIAALAVAWKKRGDNPKYLAPLAGWILIPFIVLVVMHGKRVPYLLPLLPAGCLIAGLWADRDLLDRRMGKGEKYGVSVAVTALGIILGIAVVSLMTLKAGLVSRTFDGVDISAASYVWLALMLGTAAIVTVSFLRSRRGWMETVWAVALLILTGQFGLFAVINPMLDKAKSTRSFSGEVEQLLKKSNETTLLTTNDFAEPQYHVYGNYAVQVAQREDLTSTATLPRLLALKENKIKKLDDVARAAGYVPMHETTLTKEPVMFYLRPGHD